MKVYNCKLGQNLVQKMNVVKAAAASISPSYPFAVDGIRQSYMKQTISPEKSRPSIVKDFPAAVDKLTKKICV